LASGRLSIAQLAISLRAHARLSCSAQRCSNLWNRINKDHGNPGVEYALLMPGRTLSSLKIET
jgi:hypothetical protein